MTCPGGYRCSQGTCVVGQSDGGIPRLPDGGVGVVYGPDGGIIGVIGPDGGVATLPDGGILGGDCLPGHCSEVDCNDGYDNDTNGLVDCADPGCNSLICQDSNLCSFGERCTAGGTCAATRTLVCNTPPGECFSGLCLPTESCAYPVSPGKDCGDGGYCMIDGGCGVRESTTKLPFTMPPSNFNPDTLVVPIGEVVVSGSTAQFNSTNNAFSGNWGAVYPVAATVTLSNGQSRHGALDGEAAPDLQLVRPAGRQQAGDLRGLRLGDARRDDRRFGQGQPARPRR